MKKLTKVLTLFLLCALWLPSLLHGVSALDLTTIFRISDTYANGNVSSVKMAYRLYTPEEYDESKKYALMVFFTSGKDASVDPLTQTDEMGLIENAVTNSVFAKNLFILVPNHPTGTWGDDKATVKDGAYTLSEKEPEIEQLFMKLLDAEILKNYSIDQTKVCLAGCGDGAMMVYDLCARHPERFSAAMGVNGAIDPTKIEYYEKTHLYAFADTNDASLSAKALKTLQNSIPTGGNTVINISEQGGETYRKDILSNMDHLRMLLKNSVTESKTEEPAESTAVTEEVTESANTETAEVTEAVSANVAEKEQEIAEDKTLFEKLGISTSTVAYVIAGITVLAGGIILLTAWKKTKF